MKSARTLRAALIAGCSVPGLFMASHAFAQQATQATGQIEEVTVTAERRNENI